MQGRDASRSAADRCPVPPRAAAAPGQRAELERGGTVVPSESDYSQRVKGRPLILAELKAATQMQHVEMESLVTLMDPKVSRDDVVRYLAGSLAFIRPLERALEPHREALGELGLSLDERSKVTAIEDDLKALGVSDEALASIPDFHCRPDLSTPARALGALYVLEGSTLGGAMISRHLSSALPPEHRDCLRFLGSYGADVGKMWKAFSDSLAAFPFEAGTAAEAKDTASATFVLMARALQAARPLPASP